MQPQLNTNVCQVVDMKEELAPLSDNFFEGDMKKQQVYYSSLYNPNQFVKNFKESVQILDKNKLRTLRILTQNQTIKICRDKYYVIQDKDEQNNLKQFKIVFDNDLLTYGPIHSVPFTDNEFISPALPLDKENNVCDVQIVNGDSIDVGLYIQQQLKRENLLNERVAVLNMANPNTAGGGYKAGCGAQEENLHRRTNLYQCLDNEVDKIDKNRNWKYPIGHNTVVYNPNVIVFRGNEKKGYPFFKSPKLMDFITAAAVKNTSKSTHKIDERNAVVIELILKVAITKGVRNVVLGAVGCGAFKNNPELMAKVFKEKIEKYNKYFDRVYFAILEDHNSHKDHNPDGNILPFTKVFDLNCLELKDEEIDELYH
ncbi:hypothetical protein ABK040_010311 [Willaertia magna]